MNWTAIGAIAELLGAVGVIASLLYLARQMRNGAEGRQVFSPTPVHIRQLRMGCNRLENGVHLRENSLHRSSASIRAASQGGR